MCADGANQTASGPANTLGNMPGGGTPDPNASNSGMSPADVDQAIKDMVDKLSSKTGIGTDTSTGDIKSSDKNNMKSASLMSSIATGILAAVPYTPEQLNTTSRKILKDYNLNFRRLQCHTFNGTEYNLTSGKLDKGSIYKSSLTPKIFSRDIGIKRDMDLYFNIILDTSGSMKYTYPILIDVIVPLLYSLEYLKVKSEALLFASDTFKLKDYYDDNINSLYSMAKYNFHGGSTNLLPAITYAYSVIRHRPHKDKCVIVVTDGDTCNEDECLEYIQALKRLNVCVIGIGLNLSCGELDCFQKLFGTESLLYESDDTMAKELPKDLIKLLSNKFMRR
jgi:hypothetical protein